MESPLPFDNKASQESSFSYIPIRPSLPGRWDELREVNGVPRAPWRQFFERLGEQGITRLDQSLAEVAQKVRDNTVSYNLYAESDAPHPWALDLLPFIIDEHEWSIISKGVAQRARLLNAIAADVYGEQSMLREGLLPPALVFGHPAYLRSVKGYVPTGGQYLHIVAMDLARSPNGVWTVVSPRTEAPSGLGYALENRLIVSSLFNEAFRELKVARLTASYAQLVENLAEAARATLRDSDSNQNATPSIALLTPGPRHNAYFEHAFLARQLGLILVEGKDLTVREDKLYLKTLNGLERIHAVLRRVDDDFCDPIELRNDSAIGVPGLLQAMRAGNVTIANVPGSGFIESPAMHAFLPALSQRLLGETLLLPTVPTWWCGEPAAMEEAFSQLETAYLEPSWPNAQVDGAPGMAAGPQKLGEWRERIQRSPESFAIQAVMPYSGTPYYENGSLSTRPAVLRVYAFANHAGQWHVMPGGFTRLGTEQTTTVSMQCGGSSADTWVLSSHPEASASSMHSPARPHDIARRPSRMVSSRAAENLFWAGRYTERCENNVRLCRLMLDAFQTNDVDDIFPLLTALALRSDLIPEDDALAISSPRTFEWKLIAEMGNPWGTSILQNLASQVHACSEIRGRLSNDHWRTVLAAHRNFSAAMQLFAPSDGSQSHDRNGIILALDKLAVELSAISSAHSDRMMRDEAWRLMFIGRHIERISTMSIFLDVVGSDGKITNPAHFELLLQLFDSVFTYRSLYPGRYDVRALLDLIVVDRRNPRGLYGEYESLRQKLEDMPITNTSHIPFSELLPAADGLPSLAHLCATDIDGNYIGLTAICRQLEAHAATASSEISVRYFSHANPHELQVAP